jgi:hypothetical protein
MLGDELLCTGSSPQTVNSSLLERWSDDWARGVSATH